MTSLKEFFLFAPRGLAHLLDGGAIDTRAGIREETAQRRVMQAPSSRGGRYSA